ncbi:hypothetical protein D9J22_21675 [Escherichia coli]|nr:replication protein [Escherichia coli]MMK52644.1 hypothetical protein [Escherichia coli]
MGVVKLADYRPQLEVVEHRVADTEDGFMRVANEITDSLLMADLTVRQLKVMLAIMRKTYGFNKPMDRLTNTQIAAMTGIHHTHVCAAKRQLAEQYVNQLQNLSSLEGQGQALNQYYNSQQYKDLAGQARYQSLAAAEATGGLGSTATSNQLATIAPTLGQSWLSNQMSNYNNLANVGLGALQGQANAGQTYANNMSSIAQQSAALAAANANKPSSLQTAISGGTSGAIAGAGLASLLGTSTPWGAGIGAGIGLLGSLF